MFKSVTLKDVAAKAGVSYQTVSKVINNKANVSPETEKRIWDAIADLRYTTNYSARSLRRRRSNTIGYTWEPAPPDQSNPILDTFLQSMFRAAEEKDYYLLCFPYHADDKNLLKVYRQLYDTGRVDGFVISRLNYKDPTVPYLLERNMPFVGFGRLDEADKSFPYVDVDGGEGVAQAIAHLVSLGHRKIAALAWPEDSRVGNNRMEGYYLQVRCCSMWSSIFPSGLDLLFQVLQVLLQTFNNHRIAHTTLQRLFCPFAASCSAAHPDASPSSVMP